MPKPHKTPHPGPARVREPLLRELTDSSLQGMDLTQTQSKAVGEHTGAPRNIQFSVFLDNRVGRLLSLVEVFENQPLTLSGFSILESTGHAVVRVLTSDSALARRLLFRYEYPFAESDVLVVQLDGGHTLPVMCELLMNAHLSIDYVYPLMVRPRAVPVLALHTGNNREAAQLLFDRGFTLVGEKELT
jgi:hypothetical protein